MLLASIIATEDNRLTAKLSGILLKQAKISHRTSLLPLQVFCIFFPQVVFLPLHNLLFWSKSLFLPFQSETPFLPLSVSHELALESVFPRYLALPPISLSGIILNLYLLLNSMKDFWKQLGWMTWYKIKCNCQQTNPFSHSENSDKGAPSVLNFNKYPDQRNKSQLPPEIEVVNVCPIST